MYHSGLEDASNSDKWWQFILALDDAQFSMTPWQSWLVFLGT